MVINSIEELFGTLQQAVIASWRKHLRTAKYSKHMALDEFYKEMPELVDNLIEAWMGVNGRKVKDFTNVIQSKNFNTLKYLKELRSVVKSGYPLMNGEKNLEAALDDIMELIDSTLYKVKELNENRVNLKDYINESMRVNEGDPRGDYKVYKKWDTEEIFWEYEDEDYKDDLPKSSVEHYETFKEKAETAKWKQNKNGFYIIPKGTTLEFISHNPEASHMGQFAINGDWDWVLQLMYDSLRYGEYDENIREM